MLTIGGDPNIQWVKKGDLVVFRVEFKNPAHSGRPKFWMSKAPSVRFQNQSVTPVGIPAKEDLYGIVLDKYRVSEKWGNDRHRLIWVYHLFIQESVIYFNPEERSNEVQYFLRLAENTEDDREDLPNNQGALANESTDS